LPKRAERPGDAGVDELALSGSYEQDLVAPFNHGQAITRLKRARQVFVYDKDAIARNEDLHPGLKLL